MEADNRHYWTFTTRRRFPSTKMIPVPCVSEHGIWIATNRPIPEALARETALACLPAGTLITSAVPCRAQITTRHKVGRRTEYADQDTCGVVETLHP